MYICCAQPYPVQQEVQIDASTIDSISEKIDPPSTQANTQPQLHLQTLDRFSDQNIPSNRIAVITGKLY